MKQTFSKRRIERVTLPKRLKVSCRYTRNSILDKGLSDKRFMAFYGRSLKTKNALKIIAITVQYIILEHTLNKPYYKKFYRELINKGYLDNVNLLTSKGYSLAGVKKNRL